MPKTSEITLITRLQKNLRELEPMARTELIARLRDDYEMEARTVQIIKDWKAVSSAGRNYVVSSVNGHA